MKVKKKLINLIASVILIALTLSGCSIPAPDYKVSSTQSDNNNFEIPNRFILEENIFSWGKSFSIIYDDKEVGIVKQHLMSLTDAFKLYSKEGHLIARCEVQIISWGTIVDVYDNNNQLIGRVEEQIVHGLTHAFETKYKIFDANDNLVAQSIKQELIVSKFTIVDLSDRVVCTMNQKIDFKSVWRVEFKRDIDKRLLIFIPCLKSLADDKDEE